jgi:LacI family transcriptional regulator
MRRKKQLTLNNLAGELGVTPHTVSKALRGLPGMSDETRETIREHALKRGYITKDQKLNAAQDEAVEKQEKAYRFLFVVDPDQMNDSYLHNLLLQGLQEGYAELGHSVSVLFLPYQDETDEQFAGWLAQHDVLSANGIFITPNISKHSEQRLIALDLPRILINFPPSGARIDSVVWDVYEATQVALRHLLEMGHSRMMYVGDISFTRGYKLRWQAFVEAMQEAGLEVDPQEHLHSEHWMPREEITERFIEKQKLYKPSAIICASDLDLSWLYYTYGRLQLQIPEDCSLVSLAVSPALSGVSAPQFKVKESGYRAAERMLWRIANPGQPYEHVRLVGDFSTGMTIMPAQQTLQRQT